LIINASADNFQVTYRDGSYRYSATYSCFKIFDGNHHQVAQGYTDKYGRIVINNLARGNYVCEIVYRNRTYKKEIRIEGNNAWKEVLLP
jgi:hypothetical protein